MDPPVHVYTKCCNAIKQQDQPGLPLPKTANDFTVLPISNTLQQKLVGVGVEWPYRKHVLNTSTYPLPHPRFSVVCIPSKWSGVEDFDEELYHPTHSRAVPIAFPCRLFNLFGITRLRELEELLRSLRRKQRRVEMRGGVVVGGEKEM